MKTKHFLILLFLFLYPHFGFSQDNGSDLSFKFHGGFVTADKSDNSTIYASTGMILESELAFNFNRKFALLINYNKSTIRKKVSNGSYTYLEHIGIFNVGFRYTPKIISKFGVFFDTHLGIGSAKNPEEKILEKSISPFVNFNIGLGIKYSIFKYLDVTVTSRYHINKTFSISFLGGLNFNLPAISGLK